eukprot:TRINITY_DN4627_c0_g1_i1.p1 TRINITY_DN4627_c0_g1~~TRINITY_DN4627_c0_g1_i1.p1  ORF type:complete len:195 (+),score=72.66 TRINITY_DN4627_c0_g1_i1:32-586(+)
MVKSATLRKKQARRGPAADAAAAAATETPTPAAQQSDGDEEDIPSDFAPETGAGPVAGMAADGRRGVTRSWRPWRETLKKHTRTRGRHSNPSIGDCWEKKVQMREKNKRVAGLVKEIQASRATERQNYTKRLRARRRQKLKFAIQKAEPISAQKVKRMSRRQIRRVHVMHRAGLFVPETRNNFD